MSNDSDLERKAVLSVLAAAAKEAEELLAIGEDLTRETRGEADRRLRRFMAAARQSAR
jgi:hypothetical protein